MKRLTLIVIAFCLTVGATGQNRTPKDKVDYIKTFVSLNGEQEKKLETVFIQYSKDAQTLIKETPDAKEKISALKKKLAEDLAAVMGKDKYDAYQAGVKKEREMARATLEHSKGKKDDCLGHSKDKKGGCAKCDQNHNHE